MHILFSGFTNITANFTLDPNTGDIHTIGELDREVTPEFLLCVRASRPPRTKREAVHNGHYEAAENSHGRKKRAVQDELDKVNEQTNHHEVLYLQVIIEDVNDNPPIFNDSLVRNGKIKDYTACV